MENYPIRKLCTLTQLSTFANQAYTIGGNSIYFFMSSYFSNDCAITLTVTTNPLITRIGSSYFYIYSSSTSAIGTFTINVSVNDGVNVINNSFILTASYSCATDATVIGPSSIIYYEVGDGGIIVIDQGTYSINISPGCGPITFGSVLENGGALTSKFIDTGSKIKVSTNNVADVGIYTVTQLTSLPAGATGSTINTVHITYCIVESVVLPSASNVVYYIESPHTEPYLSWSITNGVDCGPWAFNAKLNGFGISLPFTFSSSSSGLTSVNCISTSQADMGIYTIQIRGSVIGNRVQNTLTYTFEVSSICVAETYTAPTMPPITIYGTKGPQIAIPFSQFTGSLIDSTCVTYKLLKAGTTNNADTAIFTIDSVGLQILIQTNLDGKAGTYNLVLEAKSVKGGWTCQTLTFTVQIYKQCDGAVITPAILPSPVTYYIYSPALQFDITSTSTYTVLQCGNMVYTLIDMGTGLTPNSAIFTLPIATTLQILTSDQTQDGISYTIQITSQQGGWLQTGVVSLTVNIVDNCPNAIITPQPGLTLNYQLGVANSVVTLSSPTSDIAYCNTYSYSLPISNTVMFSFNSATNQLTLKSSVDVAQIGTYAMVLTSSLVVGGVTYLQSVTQPITVIISGGCVTTVITVPTIPPLIYQVGTGTLTYTFPPWSESFGTCAPFTYSALEVIILSLPTFITFTPATRTFTFLSTNDADSAIYNIQVSGALQYVSSSLTFPLEVRPTCYVTSITAVPLQPLTYIVGNPMGTVQYVPFVESPCSRGIIYTALLDDGSPLPTFIIFDPILIKFTFQTSDNLNARSYRIQVTATVNNIINTIAISEILELNVLAMTYVISTNNAPTFNSQPLDIRMPAGSNLNYQFPPVSDPDGDLVVIQLDSAPTFVLINSGTLILSPQISDIGSYSIKVTLQDNASSPKSTSYIIALAVTDVPKEQGSTNMNSTSVESQQQDFAKQLKEQKRGDYVTGKIKEITNLGVATVLFGDFMLIPENITIIDETVLDVTLIKGEESNEGLIQSWQLMSYSENQLQLQLTFNNPKLISQSVVKDKLQIIFLKNTMFIATSLDKSVQPLYTIVKQLPTQVEGDGKIHSYNISRRGFKTKFNVFTCDSRNDSNICSIILTLGVFVIEYKMTCVDQQ